MPERTPGGLFLPDHEALAMESPVMPPFAAPVEPTGPGFVLDAGFASAFLVTDAQAWTAVLDRPAVLVTSQTLGAVADMVPLLDEVAKVACPLAIVTPGMSPEVRALIVINKLRGILNIVVVETSRYADVAAYLETPVAASVQVTLATLRTAKRFASGSTTTLIQR